MTTTLIITSLFALFMALGALGLAYRLKAEIKQRQSAEKTGKSEKLA